MLHPSQVKHLTNILFEWGADPGAGRRESAGSAMLPGMAGKPHIAIVGAGNVGTALAMSLKRAGYVIEAVIGSPRSRSLGRATSLAKEVGAQARVGVQQVKAKVIWFCVPDSQIKEASQSFAKGLDSARGIVALHSSGALASDELGALRMKGAAVASVHPLMTFMRGSRPSLAAVSFALEGDPVAVRTARKIVNDLGGQAYSVRKSEKAAYHAWGAFASPLFTSLLATSEQVAALAGVDPKSARQRMIPILLQTLANYASFGPAGAFSGPIVRGDVETVRKHLQVLRRSPAAHDAYVALARAALQYLPVKNRSPLKKLLADRGD